MTARGTLGTHRPGTRRWHDTVGLALWLRVLLALVALPAGWWLSGTLGPRWLFTATLVLLAAIVATGLNVTFGLAGLLNLATGAFYAVGAYVSTLALLRWELGGFGVLALVLVVASASAYLLSLFIFRSRGFHFALLTAGVGLVAHNVLQSAEVTGGAAGLSTAGPVRDGGLAAPLAFGPLALHEPRHYFAASLVVYTLLLLALTVVLRRQLGEAWRAVRDDEVLAASVGIDVIAAKRSAFVLGSTVSAVGGLLFAYWSGYITPASFSFAAASFEPLAMVVIGGPGTIAGPLVGALVVRGVPQFFRVLEDHTTLAYGTVLLLTVLFAPTGSVGALRSRVGDLVARRRGGG